MTTRIYFRLNLLSIFRSGKDMRIVHHVYYVCISISNGTFSVEIESIFVGLLHIQYYFTHLSYVIYAIFLIYLKRLLHVYLLTHEMYIFLISYTKINHKNNFMFIAFKGEHSNWYIGTMVPNSTLFVMI